MNWRLKAAIQNAVSLLPEGLSYSAYYFIQRRFGGLRKGDVVSKFEDGARFIEKIAAQGRSIRGKAFLEVGTGRQLSIPFALWLCGAGKITTVDINPYLRPELVFEEIDYLAKNSDIVRSTLGKYTEEAEYLKRWRALLKAPREFSRVLELAQINYLSPGNAASMPLPDACVDFHISNNVLEHVPPTDIKSIILEGKRLLKADGLLIHRVDFSDHFSHTDRSISAMNFLRFTESEWQRIAGNRFMYQNRLRINEFMRLLAEAGLNILGVETDVDRACLDLLETGRLPLDARFASNKSVENATRTAWVTATV